MRHFFAGCKHRSEQHAVGQSEAAGKVVEKGVVTVVLNGVTLIEKGGFDKATGGAIDNSLGEAGPILLQDHGNKVRFRNIWLRALGQ